MGITSSSLPLHEADIVSAVSALLSNAPSESAWRDARDRLLSSTLELPTAPLFQSLHASHVRELAFKQPHSVALLLDHAIGLLAAAGAPGAGAAGHTAALNAARLLARLLPALMEEGQGGGAFCERYFWEDALPAVGSGGDAGVVWAARPARALAADAPFEAAAPAAPADCSPPGLALTHALLALLFCPNLTVHPYSWEAYEARCAEAAAAAAGGGTAAAAADPAAGGAPGAPPPPRALTPANSVYPSLVWAGGAVFPTLRPPPARDEWLRARVDLLRLLLALLSGPLYAAPGGGGGGGPPRSRFGDALTGGAAPWAPTLFFSLLNTACGYAPGGGLDGVPYAGALLGGGGAGEAVAALSLQALLALLDYAPHEGSNGEAPAFNVFRHLLARLEAPADLAFVWGGVGRLLKAAAPPPAGALPGPAWRELPLQAEALCLAWALVDGCPAAPHYLHGVGAGDALPALVAPALALLLASRKPPGRGAVAQLAALLLSRLSAGRAFGVALNTRLGPRGVSALPRELPPIDGDDGGAHVDVLLLVIHRVVVDGGPATAPLLPLLLALLSNVAPYAKALSQVASTKLLALLELFATPRFLFANERHVQITAQVLGVLNALVGYQFESNAPLVYAMLRRRELFSRLATASPRACREAEAAAAAAAAPSTATAAPLLLPAALSPAAAAAGAAGTGLETPPLAPPPAPPPAPAAPQPPARKPAAVAVTDEWWEGARAQLPLKPLLHMIEYLAPRVDSAAPAADEEALLALLRRETLAGVLPPPLPIVCVPRFFYTPYCPPSPLRIRVSPSPPPPLPSEHVFHTHSTKPHTTPPSERSTTCFKPDKTAQLWYSTTLWTSIFLNVGKTLPLFDAAAVKLFTVKVAK
jgi:hypothetical protein